MGARAKWEGCCSGGGVNTIDKQALPTQCWGGTYVASGNAGCPPANQRAYTRASHEQDIQHLPTHSSNSSI